MRERFFARLSIGLAILAGVAACTPSIGDKCQVSTDCSIRGERLCDISQPGGYCTQLNCRGQGCADEGACVLFGSALPGCGYDDRTGPFGSRSARSFCMAQCTSVTDCREGYVCADPRTYPWNAVVLDDNQSKRVCLATPLEGQDAGPGATTVVPNAMVCGPVAPPVSPIEAGPPRIHDASGVQPSPLFDAGDAGDAGAPTDAATDG